MKHILIALCLGILFLVSGCSGQQPPQAEQSLTPLTYVVGGDSAGEGYAAAQSPLVFEAATGEDSTAWLLESRERRTELNRVRYESQQEDEDELREDIAKSRNWHIVIDGESRRGYDVVKDGNGDFEDWEEPQKSDKMYGYIVHYGYS